MRNFCCVGMPMQNRGVSGAGLRDIPLHRFNRNKDRPQNTCALLALYEARIQPKYRLKEDTLAGAEALVRWNHPE